MEDRQILSAEEYAKRHKAAFRCAFDFLNQHFPPEDSAEWREQAIRDVGAASGSQLENRLAVELLAGVWEYLEDEIRRREA